jgi:glucosamine-6-phosphate deaminase
MLGYFAHVVRHFRRANNTHHFITLTSGFTSVTNKFMSEQLISLLSFLDRPGFYNLLNEGYFSKGNIVDRNRDVWLYLDGVASLNEHVKAQGCSRRLLRNLIEIFDESFLLNIPERINNGLSGQT